MIRQTRHPRQMTKVKFISVALISALLIVLLTAFFSFQHFQQQQNQKLLNHQAEVLGQLLHKDVNQQVKAVRHFKLYLATNSDISLAKFSNFSKRLMGEYNYINNIEWGVRVSKQQRAQFEAQLKAIYKTDIFISEKSSDGTINKAPLREQYHAIKYVYPFIGNDQAIGFDPSVGKGLLNNLLQAIDSGKVTLSGKIQLAQHSQQADSQKSVAVYIPILSEQDHFLGFLTLVIDVKKLLISVLADSQSTLLDNHEIRLFDKTFSKTELLYESTSAINWDQNLTSTSNITIANRIWTLELLHKSNSVQVTGLSTYNLSVLLAGLIALAIAYILLSLFRHIKHSELELIDKEIVLRETHAASSLLTVTFEAHQAIAITDTRGNILRVNQAFCDITGYSEPEVIGENPRILSSGRQSKEFYQNMWQQLTTLGKYSGEIWNRRKNGEVYPEMQTITAIKDKEGHVTHYVSLFTDITKQKQHEEKQKNLVIYDPLTLLPNRRLFMDRLDKQLAESHRYKAVGAALVIDIDDFDDINKKINFHNGDEVLILLSDRLRKMLRDTDTISRIEGDEFAVILPVKTDSADLLIDHALLVAEKIQQSLMSPFVIESHLVHVNVSIGIALIIPEAVNAVDIMRQAKTAMFKAKTMGKNKIVFETLDSELPSESI